MRWLKPLGIERVLIEWDCQPVSHTRWFGQEGHPEQVLYYCHCQGEFLGVDIYAAVPCSAEALAELEADKRDIASMFQGEVHLFIDPDGSSPSMAWPVDREVVPYLPRQGVFLTKHTKPPETVESTVQIKVTHKRDVDVCNCINKALEIALSDAKDDGAGWTGVQEFIDTVGGMGQPAVVSVIQ